MITYTDFAQKVLRILADPDGTTYTDELVYDGICAAFDAILPWLSKTGYYEYTSGSLGVQNDILLPDDVYEVDVVLDEVSGYSEVMQKASLNVGSSRGNQTSQNDWLEYPKGYLSFSYDVPSDHVIKVYYKAYWDKPASETNLQFQIEIPSIAYMGMIYYTASHCVAEKSVSTAELNPFKTKVDSGTPIMNPAKELSTWFLNRFYEEMKFIPIGYKG